MIVGHQKQWQFLKESFRLGRVPHALLFQGPEKLGKKTLAREFVKLINCQSNDFSSKPCQKCLSCQAIERGVHPDFIFIEPIGKEIQISQIRDLSLRLAEKSSLSPFKTAILDKAHLMNQEAQNSFLKTLEEPKGKTVLILVTEYPERLFPTILSRLQKIKFFPVKKEEIEDFLKEKAQHQSEARCWTGPAPKRSFWCGEISKEKIEEILIISSGKPGLVIDFLKNPEKLKERKERIKAIIKISNLPLFSRFQYAKELSRQDDLKEILDIWLNYFRKILLQNLNEKQSIQQYPLSKLQNTLWQIQKINFLISTTNINKKLALEILMLEI